MAPIPIHSSPARLDRVSYNQNPLPSLLHTPSGLALLELQGTINLPSRPDSSETLSDSETGQQTPIGRLVFPDYEHGNEGQGQGWMKRAYLYVGKHQRLTGEVKKLPKAVAVIRRRDLGEEKKNAERDERDGDGDTQLEIVELVKYKILFSSRPEPVGALTVP